MRFWHVPRRDVIILERIQWNLPSPHPKLTHLLEMKIHTKIYSITMMVQAVYVVSDKEHMQQVSAAYCTVHLYPDNSMLLIHACTRITAFITECIKRQYFNFPWLEMKNNFTLHQQRMLKPRNYYTSDVQKPMLICVAYCKRQHRVVIPQHQTLQGQLVPNKRYLLVPNVQIIYRDPTRLWGTGILVWLWPQKIHAIIILHTEAYIHLIARFTASSPSTN